LIILESLQKIEKGFVLMGTIGQRKRYLRILIL